MSKLGQDRYLRFDIAPGTHMPLDCEFAGMLGTLESRFTPMGPPA